MKSIWYHNSFKSDRGESVNQQQSSSFSGPHPSGYICGAH